MRLAGCTDGSRVAMTGSHPMARLTSSKGMTLIELMMAIVIIGLLASFALPKYEGFIEQARIARCIAEIRYLDRDIQAYVIANEEYPETLGDLHLSISNMLDPWGSAYAYLLIAPKGKGKKASIEGGGGIYYALSGMNDGTFYARNIWRLDFVAAGLESDEGSWSGSWFTSEAWAAPPPPPPTPPTPPTPPPPSGPPGPPALPRKDRFLVPINSDYDLYSKGKDGQSNAPLTVPVSHDDIIRAANGAYVGVAANF